MIEIVFNKDNGYGDRLRAAAAAAARVMGQSDKCEVSIGFVTAAAIRKLNAKFRGLDKPTDVLSFPNLALKKPAQGESAAVCAEDWPNDTGEGGGVFLGDIIICLSVAKKQAAEYGHGADREISYLFVHGLLHLYGFDHMTEPDKKLMREKEEEILLCMT